MMRKLMWVFALGLVPALAAQQDTTAAPDSAERERLQQQIEDRFGRVVQQQLQLSEDQVAKLRATEERFRTRRRDIIRGQLDLRRALNGQMCPGCSADADSVRKLMDAIETNRGELFRLQQEQNREMAGYLTPVQRAQYQMLRERFVRRLSEVRRERPLGGARERQRPLRPRRRPR
jgi:Spy/CpxP family protein refolding chaperone